MPGRATGTPTARSMTKSCSLISDSPELFSLSIRSQGDMPVSDHPGSYTPNHSLNLPTMQYRRRTGGQLSRLPTNLFRPTCGFLEKSPGAHFQTKPKRTSSACGAVVSPKGRILDNTYSFGVCLNSGMLIRSLGLGWECSLGSRVQPAPGASQPKTSQEPERKPENEQKRTRQISWPDSARIPCRQRG